jgi:hypothetical protein
MGITQQIGASSLIKPGVIDNAAARPASPFEGQVIFQKDTDQLLVWNGTTWVIPNQTTTNPEGLELITTQAIVSGTNTVSDCFTTTYTDYLVVVSDLKTAGNNAGLYMGLNGSPTVKSNGVYIPMAGTTVTADVQNTTNGSIIGFTHTTGTSYHVRVSNPRTTANTIFTSQWATPSFVGFYNGIDETGVARTGFTVNSVSTISANGTIRVYGFRNS